MDAPYIRLGVILALAGLVTFAVLRATIGAAAGVDTALLCLTAMLVAPLGVLLLLILPHLYRNMRANLVLYAAFTCLFLGAWTAGRSDALAQSQAGLRAAAGQLARS
ncbi:MAG: hypothetical protein E6G92_13985 [Alphaproteobacteria bacterium]|nr:MAG: hypothetical protein E6G92_13985 [Alphaproteobacteria bacterium]